MITFAFFVAALSLWPVLRAAELLEALDRAERTSHIRLVEHCASGWNRGRA